MIDRLIVREHEVIIVDYKTNRIVPVTLADVPQAYVMQLAAYRLAVRALYPGRPVRCVLIWTAGNQASWLEEAQLASAEAVLTQLGPDQLAPDQLAPDQLAPDQAV